MDSEDESNNDFPAIDVNSENWAEDYTNSIRRFHKSGNCSYRTFDENEERRPTVTGFSPHTTRAEHFVDIVFRSIRVVIHADGVLPC